jgi:hypothetical protein
MHRDHLRPGTAVALALAAMVLCPQANAQDYLAVKPGIHVAQAGSMGGSIGNTEKSLSGSRGQPSSASHVSTNHPASRNSTDEGSFPKTIQMTDRAYGLSYSITLHNVGGNKYEGTWSHGYATQFTMTAFTKDSIKMSRNDKPAFGAVTGSYAGSRSGNHAMGEATVSNGAASKWDASW